MAGWGSGYKKVDFSKQMLFLHYLCCLFGCLFGCSHILVDPKQNQGPNHKTRIKRRMISRDKR
jgi:hypothetical protein